MADILIAGGGIAGSAAAIQLGRIGFSVDLFEREQFPREKPCGEGLMPAGVAALARLSIRRPLEGAPFLGIRYNCPERTFFAPFASNGCSPVGHGHRRWILDQAIFEAARNTPNVRAYSGVRVEAPVIENGRICGLAVEGESRRGRLVIAADGARSCLRQRLGLNAPAGSKRIGLRAHFRLAPGQPQSEWVDVFLGNGFELYTTPLRHRELAVAALIHANGFHGPAEKQFQTFCAAEPRLAARLEGAQQITDLQAAAPLSGSALRGILPGCVLLGDAAGFADPINGSGMTQALLAAELFVQYAARGFDGMDRWLEEFDRARRLLLSDCRRLADIMVWLATRHDLAVGVLKILAKRPPLLSHLLGVASSTRRLLGGNLRPHSPPLGKGNGIKREFTWRCEI